MSLSRSLRRLWKRKRKLPPRRNRVLFEPLEPRLLLDAVVAHWIGGSGNWSDPTHWDINAVPNNSGPTTYTAIVDLASSDPTITVDQSVSISSLTSSESVQVQSGRSLAISGNVTNTGTLSTAGTLQFSNSMVSNIGHTIMLDGGTLQLNNSTVQGGALADTGLGGAVLVQSSATLDGVTLDADLTIGDNQSLHVKNGLVLNSTITLTGTNPYYYYTYRQLYFDGTQTLSGTGQVVMDGTDGDSLAYLNLSGVYGAMTLTVAPGITIRGMGLIRSDGYYGTVGTVVNQGVIRADVSGKGLSFNTSTLTNQGSLEATAGGLSLSGTWSNSGTFVVSDGGGLALGGTFTTAGLGAFNRTGGSVNLTGTLTNTGATLALDATT